MNPSEILHSIRRRVTKAWVTPDKIRQLTAAPDTNVASIGRAIDKTWSRVRTPEEGRWIRAIEERRASLLASSEVVEVPDFGAGSPADKRSEGEMSAGHICVEIVGQACLNYSKPPFWAELIFHIIRQFKPLSCIEMGACVGVSTAYQASALELNDMGALKTMEGSPSFARITAETLEALGLKHRATVVVGRFSDTLADVLSASRPVDCCFIDGHHDEKATYGYFENILPHLASESVLIFDDIRWSPGMLRVWEKIRADSRAGVSIDLGKIGICLTGAGRHGRHVMVLE